MATGKAITDFLKNHIRNLGTSGIVLIVLEKILDTEFVCPCKPRYNEGVFSLYFIISSIACFVVTFYFVDLSPKTEDGKKDNSESNKKNKSDVPLLDRVGKGREGDTTSSSSNVEDGKTMEKSKRNKFLYSALVTFIWLFLLFIDGRYLACACSNWEGSYTKSDTLGNAKWCKPTGNETSLIESQNKTLKCMSISQIIGFGLMSFFIMILTLMSEWNRCPDWRRKCSDFCRKYCSDCCLNCCRNCRECCSGNWSKCCYNFFIVAVIFLAILSFVGAIVLAVTVTY
ncbi:uncharacterized protein LOC128317596 [Pangasianodon hypophthalmus]|uniref:uncharacterized protein LOC128317596 n=1 Tax=Pangasianodon hypophthalmus TaxID=310915 RepID=UPI002307C658|nr:uncharacterized protein LOC128317596 [Pangasianodon hypophthalmus]